MADEPNTPPQNLQEQIEQIKQTNQRLQQAKDNILARVEQHKAPIDKLRALGPNPPLKYRSVEELKAQNPALYARIQALDEAKRSRLAEHRQIINEHKARIAATKSRVR
jgi:hypothetical protein